MGGAAGYDREQAGGLVRQLAFIPRRRSVLGRGDEASEPESSPREPSHSQGNAGGNEEDWGRGSGAGGKSRLEPPG